MTNELTYADAHGCLAKLEEVIGTLNTMINTPHGARVSIITADILAVEIKITKLYKGMTGRDL